LIQRTNDRAVLVGSQRVEEFVAAIDEMAERPISPVCRSRLPRRRHAWETRNREIDPAE
jgi:hypothetical protein